MAWTRPIVETAESFQAMQAAASELTPEERAAMDARGAAYVAEHGFGPPPPPTGAGAVADLLFLPVHAAAAIFSAGAQEIGRAAQWTDAVEVGKAAVMADAELSHAIGEKPLAAVQVAGGVVLAATGIATSVGAGLIANGARELAGQVFHDLGVADVQGPPPGRDAPAQPSQSGTAPDAPHRAGL